MFHYRTSFAWPSMIEIIVTVWIPFPSAVVRVLVDADYHPRPELKARSNPTRY